MLDLTIGLFDTEDSHNALDALLGAQAGGEQPATGADSPGITFTGR